MGGGKGSKQPLKFCLGVCLGWGVSYSRLGWGLVQWGWGWEGALLAGAPNPPKPPSPHLTDELGVVLGEEALAVCGGGAGGTAPRVFCCVCGACVQLFYGIGGGLC